MRLILPRGIVRQAIVIAIAFSIGSATVVYAGPTVSGFVGLTDGTNTAKISAAGALSTTDATADAQLAKLSFDGSGNLMTTGGGAGGVVTIAGTPTVNIANTPSVTLSGTPAVALASGSAVSIAGTPSVNLVGAATTRRAADALLNVDKQAFLTTPFDSGDLAVGSYTELAFDMTAGNSRLVGTFCCGPCTGSLDVTISRKAAGGAWYTIDHFVLADFAVMSRSYGVGAPQNVSFGGTLRVYVQPTGGGFGCGANYAVSLIGK
jgi:hypothetical protein